MKFYARFRNDGGVSLESVYFLGDEISPELKASTELTPGFIRWVNIKGKYPSILEVMNLQTEFKKPSKRYDVEIMDIDA